MTRNLKVLGLALMAAFAFSAVAASAASAQQGTLTSDGPVTLTGTETGENTNLLTAFGLTVKCPGSTYGGHKVGSTTAFLPSGSTTATLTPKYINCVSGAFPVTVDMNGCDYVVHLGETTGGVAGTYGVTFDVVCTAPNVIKVTAFTNAADHTAGKPFCTLEVKAQTGLKGAHATDTGNGHIDLTGTVEGIHIARSGSHVVLCPASTIATGKLDLDVTVAGHNEAKGATGISLSHP